MTSIVSPVCDACCDKSRRTTLLSARVSKHETVSRGPVNTIHSVLISEDKRPQVLWTQCKACQSVKPNDQGSCEHIANTMQNVSVSETKRPQVL